MVATIAKLKLILLKNSLKRSPWQIVGLIIGLLYGLFVAALLVAALVAARWLEVEQRALIVVLGGSVLVLLWWIIPLLTSTLDQTVDVTRFTILPIPRRQLITGIAVSGIIGTPGILTVLILIGTLITWSNGVLSFIYALIGGVLVLLLTQFGARLLTTFVAGFLSGRRAQELMTVILLLLIFMLWPVFTILIELLSDITDVDAVVRQLTEITAVAGWLPFGAPWAAAADAAAGNWFTGLLKLLIAAVTVVIFAVWWAKLLDSVLTNPKTEKVSAKSSTGVIDSLATSAVSGIAVKTIRYWFRDNRLAVSNMIIILLPILAVLVTLFARDFIQLGDELIASMGVIIAAIYGWGTHNMLAYDGSAYWMQLISGVRGWKDRLGRLITEGGIGLFCVLISVTVGIVLSGRYDLLLVQLGTAIGVLCAGLAVSTAVSTIWIYAIPAPGENPFNTPSGAGGLTMLAQFVSMGANFVLSLPVLIPFFWVLWFQDDAPAWVGAATLGLGLVTGALWLWLGVRMGGKRLDTRGPEVLAQLQKFS